MVKYFGQMNVRLSASKVDGMGCRWSVFVLLGVIVSVGCSKPGDVGVTMVSSVVGTKISSRPGRHVCTAEKTMATPIAVVQQYKKPVYTPRERDCPSLTSCPQYDVSYVLANRTIFQLQKASTFEHSCCPGWTKGSKREKGCHAPICSSGCGEFGVCVKPEVCKCQPGYSGPMCDTDIDECMTKDNGCHQICKNTAGSYVCACQEGFSLAANGRSCLFCFTCQKEYIDLLTSVHMLQNQLQNTSFDKAGLEDQNQQLSDQIEALTGEITQLKSQQNSSQSIKASMEIQLETLKEEIQNISQTKVSDDGPDLAFVNATLDDMRSEIESLRSQNTLLRTTITGMEDKFEIVMTDVDSLRNMTLAAPPAADKEEAFSTTTPGGIQYDPYDLIISLSNQIGLMEEKLHFCQCENRGRG